jgi:RNA polymerase sigma factor (TIGR02999 family)
VFVKLSAGQDIDWQGRTHFMAVAVRAMRQVLIDHERARGAKKRGGGVNRVRLEDAERLTGGAEIDWENLERALKELGSADPRAAQVVELRFFGGLTGEQIGGILGISPATVKKDWRFAKAWLRRRLGEEA